MRVDNVRLAFPAIFKPQSFNDGDPRFSAVLIIPTDHPDVSKVKATMQEVAKKKWGNDAAEIFKTLVSKGRVCLRPGSDKRKDDGKYPDGFGPDMMFINASNATRPSVFDADKSPLVGADGRPYAGCYVNATVDIWAQDNQYGKRINATLTGVQFYRHGDAFSGGAPASADEFDAVDGEGQDAAADTTAQDADSFWG